MHLTIVNINADVTCIRTGKRTLGHLVVDTLEDSGHEAKIDSSTDNAVVELEFSAPFEVEGLRGLDVEDGVLSVNLELGRSGLSFDIRANEEMNLTELTCTTGLLLVTILSGSDLCDGLTVRNLRSKEFDVKLELVLHSPLDEVDVLLTLSAENGLTELLGVLNEDGRILCGDLVESLTDLCLIVLVDSLDCATVLGIGELHVLNRIDTGCSEGNVGLSVLEFHDATDISGVD